MLDLVASQVFNTPLLIESTKLDAIAMVVASRMGLEGVEAPEFKGMAPSLSLPDNAMYDPEGGYHIADGIAVIGVLGSLIHRGGFMNSMSGLTSYTAIAKSFKHAMKNPRVDSVLLDTNSPGGAANGAFDLADRIFNARGIKPIFAIAEDNMASAAYLVASSADKVFTTQTGRIGSIGVVMKHLDVSQWNADVGLNPTYIYAGDYKIDGNMDNPLGKDVLARFQADIDQLYGMFVGAVSRHRGMDEQAVIDTQAAIYMGHDAVSAGLADEVANIEEVLDRLRAEVRGAGSRQTLTMEETPMTVEAKKVEGADAPETTTKVSEPAAAAEKDTSVADAVAEDRKRTQAIMDSDEAKGRQEAAMALATESDMSADAAIALLGKMPTADKGPSKLDAAMAGTDQPGIGAEGEASAEETETAAMVSAIGRGISKNMR